MFTMAQWIPAAPAPRRPFFFPVLATICDDGTTTSANSPVAASQQRQRCRWSHNDRLVVVDERVGAFALRARRILPSLLGARGGSRWTSALAVRHGQFHPLSVVGPDEDPIDEQYVHCSFRSPEGRLQLQRIGGVRTDSLLSSTTTSSSRSAHPPHDRSMVSVCRSVDRACEVSRERILQPSHEAGPAKC